MRLRRRGWRSSASSRRTRASAGSVFSIGVWTVMAGPFLWSVAAPRAQKGAGAGDMAAGPRESRKGGQRAAEAALPGSAAPTARIWSIVCAGLARSGGAAAAEGTCGGRPGGEVCFVETWRHSFGKRTAAAERGGGNVLYTRRYISENAPRQGYSVPYGKDFLSASRPEL